MDFLQVTDEWEDTHIGYSMYYHLLPTFACSGAKLAPYLRKMAFFAEVLRDQSCRKSFNNVLEPQECKYT